MQFRTRSVVINIILLLVFLVQTVIFIYIFDQYVYIIAIGALSLLLVFFYKVRLEMKLFNSFSLVQGSFDKIVNEKTTHGIISPEEIELQEVKFFYSALVGLVEDMQSEISSQVKSGSKEFRSQEKELKSKNVLLEDTKIAMLNLLEDLDEEKDFLQRERDRINTILQSIGDAVFVVDRNKKIILFNDMASKITGIEAKKAIGKKYDKVVKFVYEKTGRKADEFVNLVLEDGESQQVQRNVMLKINKNKKIPVADSAAPVKDHNGNIIACVIVFRDITRERQIDRAKTEFVSLASHQLRTPLSTIKWYVASMISGDTGKITKKQKDYLEYIHKGNQRLIDLVNALLNVSRLELGTFYVKPQKENFSEIIEKAMEHFNILIKSKKLQLSLFLDKKLPKMMIDRNLMLIIAQNLISNSVKYTPDKGKISITLKKINNHVQFIVKDTGVGIPQSQHRDIFKKLFRADNIRKLDTEGTGLGLYIVKSIVDTTGGSVNFKSSEGKGTEFIVQYPLAGMQKKTGEKSLTLIDGESK